MLERLVKSLNHSWNANSPTFNFTHGGYYAILSFIDLNDWPSIYFA